MATKGKLKILLAIDGSDSADKAFSWYVEKLHQPGYEVVLVHVPEFWDTERNRMMYLTGRYFSFSETLIRLNTLNMKSHYFLFGGFSFYPLRVAPDVF